jgi:hypothetical protein
MAIDVTSRFKYTPYIKFGGQTTYGLWVKPRFMTAARYTTYKVYSGMGGRLDLISDDVYDTPDLYWVIAMFNNVRTLNWPPVGVTIKIPLKEDILYEF